MVSVSRRVVAGTILALAGLAGTASAGTFSSYNLDNDVNSGITSSSGYIYTHAFDLNGTGETINGVTFSPGGTSVSGKYDSTGLDNSIPNNGNDHPTGQIHQLLSDFYYNNAGSQDSITLKNLTPGQSYVTSFYNSSYGGPGGRLQNVTTSDGGSVSFDQNYLPGSRLDYRFTAASNSLTFTFTPNPNPSNSFHQYGFSNRTAGTPIASLFNTGVDATGKPLPDGTVNDPHYTLKSVPSGTTDTLVRTSAGGFPIPPYLGDTSTSAWIGPNTDHNLDGVSGDYDYQTNFTLPSYADLKSVLISGNFASDNATVSLKLNGVEVTPAQNLATGFSSFESFFIDGSILGNDFLVGNNTLDFVVHNNGSDPTAFRVDNISGEYVPEPSSLSLIGVGTMLLLRRRRK